MKQTREDIKYLKARCAKYDTDYAVMCKDIADIKESISEIKENQKTYMQDMKDFMEVIEKKYVSQVEFTPIKSIVYGLIGLVGTAFVVGLIALVWKTQI